MKFSIKQKILSFTDSFAIKDESGNDTYMVRKQIFAIRKRFFVRDMSGNELAIVQKKIFTILPQFEIFLSDGSYAKVKKKFTFFKSAFDIESTLGNYRMNGDFLSHEFEIYKDGSVVARVTKKWIALSDTYGVEISDDENPILLLSIIMTIDATLHDDNHRVHLLNLGD